MKLYLTAVGQALLYKAQGGQTLKLTRFGLGNGELGGQAIQELTALINEKMSSNITKLNVNTNKVVVGMSFTNSELTEGFYFRELGLFAEDPDSGEEVLYMYANAAEASDYIDSNTGKVIEENLDVEIIISEVENITATIDGSLVYLTLNGDASNTTVTFTESEEKTNIESGDTLSVLFGKIRKWFSSLKAIAFSGSYNDLDNKPTIPAAYELPIATNDTLGGIKIGANLTIREDGTMDAEASSSSLIFENITVAATAWIEDTTYEEFGYKAEIPCTGVTADFFSDVTFDVTEAISGNYAPISLTGDGIVTIYAVEQPESTIIIPSIICSKGA